MANDQADARDKRARRNVRCICSSMLFEILEPFNHRDQQGPEIRIRCERCEYLAWRFGLDKQMNGDVLKRNAVRVFHVVDMGTARPIRSRTQVIVGAQRNAREGDRGGTVIDTAVLDAAVERTQQGV